MQYVAVFVFMHMYVYLCAYMCVCCAPFLLQRELLEAFPTLKYLWHIQAENKNQIFIFPAQFNHKMLTLVFHPQSLPSPFSNTPQFRVNFSKFLKLPRDFQLCWCNVNVPSTTFLKRNWWENGPFGFVFAFYSCFSVKIQGTFKNWTAKINNFFFAYICIYLIIFILH